MYPRISDFFNEIFGTSFCLPIQSFGFFVALAFLAAYLVLARECLRMQNLGRFPTRKVKVIKGGPIKELDILVTFALFGIIGFKLGLMFEDYDIFCSNPQDAILSTRGSFLWAFIAAFIAGGIRFYQYWTHRNETPTETMEEQGILQELGTITTIAFVAGILGAKVFHNLEDWENFSADPIGALFSFDGLTFYGGLIVATIFIARYLRKKGYDRWTFADAISPAMILSYGVGRIGCQVAGDGDWGIENAAPKPGWLSWAPDWVWAYDYPHNVLRRGVPIEGCEGDFCNHLVPPVFPTPFYEILMALAIFGVLWMLRKRLPYVGQMTGLYLVLNGIERFLIEKIRVNSTYDIFGAEITQAEIISSLMVLGGLVIFYLATVKWKRTGTT